MKLKNNLYTIANKQLTGLQGSYQLSLNPDCVIYQAHFPGEPITPGVCIVQMGKEVLEDALGKDLEITLVKNVKFLSIISPLENKEITYLLKKVEESNEDRSVKAQMVVMGGEEAKAKLSFSLRIM